MYDYETLSRKGLVKMAEDFDTENEGSLSVFVEAKETNGQPYQLITPAEFVFSNFDEKKDELVGHIKDKVDGVSETLDRVINAIFSGEDEVGDKLLTECTETIFNK